MLTMPKNVPWPTFGTRPTAVVPGVQDAKKKIVWASARTAPSNTVQYNRRPVPCLSWDLLLLRDVMCVSWTRGRNKAVVRVRVESLHTAPVAATLRQWAGGLYMQPTP